MNNIKAEKNIDHISVCICTYKRPEMLLEALKSISRQQTEDKFTFELVIVDNDFSRSAEPFIKEFETHSDLNIIYDCEPEQNISLSRNRCVRNSSGNLLAFIDDDEVPVENWLLRLFNTLKEFQADGILGPVLPSFPESAPQWLSKCNLFNRRRFKTGTRLTNSRDTRTGNVLLSLSSLLKDTVWFDPLFGRTGGEDVNFFSKQITDGKTFIWCDDAIAYETIPPERWKSSFYIKRNFRSGAVNGKKFKNSFKVLFIKFLKSIISILFWTIIFPFLIPFGKHVWFPPVLKLSYHWGFILSVCGIPLFIKRD